MTKKLLLIILLTIIFPTNILANDTEIHVVLDETEQVLPHENKALTTSSEAHGVEIEEDTAIQIVSNETDQVLPHENKGLPTSSKEHDVIIKEDTEIHVVLDENQQVIPQDDIVLSKKVDESHYQPSSNHYVEIEDSTQTNVIVKEKETTPNHQPSVNKQTTVAQTTEKKTIQPPANVLLESPAFEHNPHYKPPLRPKRKTIEKKPAVVTPQKVKQPTQMKVVTPILPMTPPKIRIPVNTTKQDLLTLGITLASIIVLRLLKPKNE